MLAKTDKKGFIDYVNISGRSADLNGPNAYTIEDVNDEDTTNTRISALWEPHQDVRVIATYFNQNQKVGGRQIANQALTGDKYSAALQHVEPNEQVSNSDTALLWIAGVFYTKRDHYSI